MSSSAAAGKSALSLLRRARGHELVAAARRRRRRGCRGTGRSRRRSRRLRACRRRPSPPTRASRGGRRSPTGRPFDEVLRAALGLVAEDGDAEVVRLVHPAARLVPAPAVDGDAQAADGRAAGRVPQLRVLVRLPTSTTRLMFAAMLSSLLLWVFRLDVAFSSSTESSASSEMRFGSAYSSSAYGAIVLPDGRRGGRRRRSRRAARSCASRRCGGSRGAASRRRRS